MCALLVSAFDVGGSVYACFACVMHMEFVVHIGCARCSMFCNECNACSVNTRCVRCAVVPALRVVYSVRQELHERCLWCLRSGMTLYRMA